MMTANSLIDQTAAAENAVATLYHALFTGLILTVASRKDAAAAGDLVFQIFRRQHHEKFLSSLEKLGLADLPHAVLAAQYHYLSNAIGGVAVEYMYESDEKAWVRFVHPRWMYEGTALCGMPIEVSHGFLRGWYAHNGVSLGNPRLGFVCTSQDMDGQYGLAGYFREYDRALAPEERLRFAPEEHPPPFDAAAAPSVSSDLWPAERLRKAKRNYAMEYVKSSLPVLIAKFGPAEGAYLGAMAGELIGRQYYAEAKSTTGVSGETAADFARFMAATAAAQGDACDWNEDDTGIAYFRQSTWRAMRGAGRLHAAVFDAWNGLWRGCLSAHNRFLAMDVTGRMDQGDSHFEWRIRNLPAEPPVW